MLYKVYTFIIENVKKNQKVIIPALSFLHCFVLFIPSLLCTFLHSGGVTISQVEYPLPEMLGNKSVLNFAFFQVLEYLHIHNEISWVWDPSLSMKLICVLYMPYTRRLMMVLYSNSVFCL